MGNDVPTQSIPSNENDELTTNETILKELFSDVRQCNYDDMRIRIKNLGGKSVINKLRSPYGKSKALLWVAVIWKNKFSTAIQKRDFIKHLEMEFSPDFNLTNAYNCNIIHDLCMDKESVDIDTSILLLHYFIYESKCINIKSFIKQDGQQRTPLHYAVSSNKLQCVDLLLRYYNKYNIYHMKDKNSKTIIQFAEHKPIILKSLTNHVKNNINTEVIQEEEGVEIKNAEIEQKMEEEIKKRIVNEKKIISSAMTKVTKIIENYDEKEFKESIKTDISKKHLKGLNLNNKQLKTSYCLENQTLQFIFHCYNNDKNIEWKQPIGFWVTYNILDEQIIENMNNVSKNAVISYEIGALLIDRYNDEPLFIKGVMNALRQSNAIEQPFHIVIKTNVSKNNTSET
eukprot:325003_1